jgi:ABC-type polar amino acid transport system ATPase subunit
MTSTIAPAIEFASVSKSFGETAVLSDITLSISVGERTVICGPSGAGKSTLIRCINGLEQHQRGVIRVDGETLTRAAPSLRHIRAQVGMVFQGFNLFPHMTVLENCTVAPRTALGLTRQEAEGRAQALLRRVDLPGLGGRYPSQLSGGQQQRVAIARALCMQPRILLLDEPTSALDPEMVQEVLDTIVGLTDLGMTMVCVTHEMSFARRLATRVVFMDEGRIVETGPPTELFDTPQSVRLQRFLGSLQALP